MSRRNCTEDFQTFSYTAKADVPMAFAHNASAVRGCGSCKKTVYDISVLTRENARRFLREYAQEHHELPCVRRVENGRGLVFVDDKTGQLGKQIAGANRLLFAASLAVPLLFVGCEQPPRPEAVGVVEAEAVPSATESQEPGAAAMIRPESEQQTVAQEKAPVEYPLTDQALDILQFVIDDFLALIPEKEEPATKRSEAVTMGLIF